nr:RAMP superfamily CRISPR-associated protein [uncultured Fusobacterium sp.]
MDFSKFENRYKITGELVVLTALHIGSGKEGDNQDSPFMSLKVNGNEVYYIPGSSFRGYLSTKLERFLEEENGIVLKDKNTKDILNSADVKLIFGYTNLDGEKVEVQNRIAKKLGYKNLDQINSFKSMAGRIHIADMKILLEIKSIKRD